MRPRTVLFLTAIFPSRSLVSCPRIVASLGQRLQKFLKTMRIFRRSWTPVSGYGAVLVLAGGYRAVLDFRDLILS